MTGTRLGAAGPEVSRICLGTWAFGGNWGPSEPRTAERTIAAARDAGVNFFDTAYSYGAGRSEEILGRALREEVLRDRERVVIATKAGLRIDGDRMVRDSSPRQLRNGVEASLRRLGVDYVDLVYVHWPDPATPFAVSAEALAELVSEDKVRWIGVSNFDAGQLAAFAAEIPVTAVQPPFHMLRREAAEHLFPACLDRGIGLAAYSPLAHGLLAGSVTRERAFHADDWRRGRPEFRGSGLKRNLDVVHDLAEVASGRGIALPALAVGWVLAHEAVTTAIVGARNPDQLCPAIEAPEVELSDEDMAALDRILRRSVPIEGPRPETRRLARVRE